MAVILDGKQLAAECKQKITETVRVFVQRHALLPTLATILVGENPASQIYVQNKVRATKECGMRSIHLSFPSTISETELLQQIQILNDDKTVHGILVQLPLPTHINSMAVIEAISPKKDVDAFHPLTVGRLTIGQDGFKPCTPFGIMRLIEHYEIDLKGKDALVIGKSNIVGKPLALLLLAAGATVTVAHSQTLDLPAKVARADLVVSAVGNPKFIAGDWIKPGAVVIDVGINRLPNGKLCGDVDFELAKQKASHITPVPGGVGPMTIAMLLHNTVLAAEKSV